MPPNPQSHRHHQNDNPDKRNPNPRILTFILRSIIMLLVISSFFLFLFIAAIAVVHLLLSHRRRPAAKTISLLQRLPPCFSYTIDTSETESWLNVCAVCLEECREGDACRRLVGCCHVYHSRCVDRWLVKVPNCPVCRTPVRLDVSGRVSGVDYESKVLWG